MRGGLTSAVLDTFAYNKHNTSQFILFYSCPTEEPLKKLIGLIALVAILVVIVLGYGRQDNRDRDTHKEANIISTESSARGAPPKTSCPYTFISWNIANFGRKKTDEEIALIAKVLAHADIVAVQEVVAGKEFGAQAIAKLALALGRTGAAWDYTVSDPTRPPSAGVERYAYLWKRHTMTVNRDNARLVQELQASVDREPYALLFQPKESAPLYVFSVHTVPVAKQPIREVEALVSAKEVRAVKRAIIAGDFNLSRKKADPLFARIGFTGHITASTSLRGFVGRNGYRSRQYDNVYTKDLRVCTAGVIDFVGTYFAPVTDESLRNARHLSDHLPVFVTFR